MSADLYGFDGMPRRRDRFVRETQPQDQAAHEQYISRVRMARGTGQHRPAPERTVEWFAVAILGILLALALATLGLGPYP